MIHDYEVIVSALSTLFNIIRDAYPEIVKEEDHVKRIGVVTANPSQFLIHQRLGHTRFLGRGRAALVMPWIDRYYLIPSGAQSVSFRADQITAENQGVEVTGFAIWSIIDPERAVQAVDFSAPDQAMERIGAHLREIVESAIRHQVANLALEESLRKRGSIIERLKAELASVASKWGLDIATVEIKTVRIMSAQLFENMQARFRDAVRLESERSAMETDEQVQSEQAVVREEVARRETAFREAEATRTATLRRNELERETETERLRTEKRLRLELNQLETELQLTQGRVSRRRQALEAEKTLIELDEALEARRFQLDRVRAENRNAIAEADDAIERRRIETTNTRDAGKLLLDNLPGLLAEMKIEHLNLGDPMMVAAITRLATSIAKPSGTALTPTRIEQ
ncbi:MAG: hypothetical protein H0U23_09675 [Blastocatellia bacterium]|nr:hypothetical protein [Blastocatellia bacterium]